MHSTQAKSLGELWENVNGKQSSWLISVANLTFCFGAALSYSILLGDSFQALAKAVGISSGMVATRAFWVLLVSITVLLPLCTLQSLASLAPVSIAGVVGIFVTTIFVGWRCPAINAASPYANAGALLATLAPHQIPKFGTISKAFGSPASMVLGGMAATAFLGHFSAPDFYHSLKRRDKDAAITATSAETISCPSTLRNFFRVAIGGYGGVALINCLIMAFGFLTFGGNSNGIILSNYSTMDPFASLCRMLMAICVIGGYPFVISACRGEILALWKSKYSTGPIRQFEVNVSRILLVILSGLALVMKNAGFVVGFNGSLMGSAIV